MNTRAPGARRGAHRSSRDIAGAVVPSLLAVLAVTAMITALYVWRGESHDTTTPAIATTKSSSAPASSATGTPKATTKTASKPAVSAATRTATTATTKPAARVGDLEVVVLNQSSRKGLAGTVAQRLRDKGWKVALTGNFRGQVTATTVYYPPGAQADAEAAAAGLPTTPRVRPRFGNLSTSRLTVVVTDSYPS
ncbi:MAG: LytR C-terminal domain-containing protein [Sporichthyaceae bacterium]